MGNGLPEPGGGIVPRTLLVYGASLVASGGFMVFVFATLREHYWGLAMLGIAYVPLAFFTRVRRSLRKRATELTAFCGCSGVAVGYVLLRLPATGPAAEVGPVGVLWAFGLSATGLVVSAVTGRPLPRTRPPPRPLPRSERTLSDWLGWLAALATTLVVGLVVVPQQV